MYSRSTGEVKSNRIMSSLLRKRTRLPTHAHEVRALTFEVSDNFGSNDVLPCGAYGPWFALLSSHTNDLKTGNLVTALPDVSQGSCQESFVRFQHCMTE